MSIKEEGNKRARQKLLSHKALGKLLSKKNDGINHEHKALYAGGRLVISMVAEHFNQYIDLIVNPHLPEGHQLMHTRKEQVRFGEWNDRLSYEITTGAITFPQGVQQGASGIESRVVQLCEEYKTKSPWVSRITYAFRQKQN